MSWRHLVRQVAEDLRQGRHREAYTIFTIGAVLTVLGLVNVVEERVLLSGVLLAVAFLAFETTLERESASRGLEQVIRGRDALGAFSAVLPDGGEVLLYGPTLVNVVVNAAAIKTKVLDKGGRVRAIVQDPDSHAVRFTKAQLEDSLDFDFALASSIATLRKMRGWGDCDFRLLEFSPGFSMVVVNPTRPDGFLLLELHGFDNAAITERMHLRINRAESVRWFDYWASRFERMWEQSRKA
ncbi:MAG: hypothetical protein ACRD0K_21135 [Egibacteraceae bacterium]